MAEVSNEAWKEELIAEWEPKVRIQIEYRDVEVDEEHPDGRESRFIYTSVHPIDSHECGLMLVVPGIEVQLPEFSHHEAIHAIAEYMGNHPDGNFCDNDDCEHPDREGEDDGEDQ